MSKSDVLRQSIEGISVEKKYGLPMVSELVNKARRLRGSQFGANIITGPLTAIFSAICMAISYPIYLHYLGYERYGLWLVGSTVLSFVQLGNFGFGPALARQVADEQGRGDLRGIRSSIATAVAALAVLGTVAAALVLTLTTPIVNTLSLTPANAVVLKHLLPLMLCVTAYAFVIDGLNSAVFGLGRMDLANASQAAVQLVTVVAAISLLRTGWGIEALVAANAAGYLALHLTTVLILRRLTGGPILLMNLISLSKARQMTSFGCRLMGGSLFGMLMTPLNRLVLSHYAGLASVPVYDIATSVGSRIRTLFDSGIRAVMPEVSRKRARGEFAEIGSLHQQVWWLVLVTGAAVFGTAAILAALVLRLWLGSQYREPLAMATRISLVGAFSSILGVPAFYVLMGLGRGTQILVGTAIQSATNVLLLSALAFGAWSVTPYSVLAAASTGMAVSASYLLWAKHNSTCCGA